MMLVGRDDDLAGVVALLTADGPRGRLVHLRGEPGSGRSSLLDAVARRLRSAALPVVVCGPAESGHSLPVADQLIQHLLAQPDRSVQPGLARALTAVSRVHQLATREPDRYQVALAHELTGAVRALGRSRRPYLLIDDLDRAPAPSLSLVCLLLDTLREAGCRILVVGPGPGEAGAGKVPEAVAELLGSADCSVRPTDLDEAQVGQLVEAHLRCSAGQDVVQAVTGALGSAAGLPGAVLGVVDWAQRSQRLVTVEGWAHLVRPDVPLGLPDGHHLLGPGGCRWAAALAVLGVVRHRELSVVSTVCGVDLDVLRRIVTELHHTGILVDREHELRFAVPAVQSALAMAVEPETKRALHAALAKLLLADLTDGLLVDEYRLADHLAKAGDQVGGTQVTDLLLSTARRALATEPARAISWHLAAFKLIEPGSTAWFAAVESLLPILVEHGWFDEAAKISGRVLPHVVERGDSRLTGVVLLWKVLALAHDNQVDRLVSAAHSAVGLLERAGLDSSGMRLMAALHTEDFRAAGPLVHQLRRGPQLKEYNKNSALAAIWYHSVAGEAEAFRENWRECLAGHLDPPDREDVREAASLGDISELRELWFGSVPGRSESGRVRRYQRVRNHFIAGRWEQALQLARQLRAEQLPDPTAYTQHLVRALAAEIYVQRGDTKRALDWLSEASDTVLYGHMVSWIRCGAMNLAGERADAIEWGEAAYRRARSLGYLGGLEPLLGRLVDLGVAESDGERWLREATELDDLVGSRASRRVLLRARTMIKGDRQAAAELLEIVRPLGRPSVLAAAALIAGRAGLEPEQTLRESYELFRQLKATPGRLAAAAALKERGLPVPRSRAPRDSLSAVELRLAALVADGETNRRIAVTLNVSEKTVESYLTQLFTKTKCRSRVELTVAFTAGRL